MVKKFGFGDFVSTIRDRTQVVESKNVTLTNRFCFVRRYGVTNLLKADVERIMFHERVSVFNFKSNFT